MKKYQEQHVFFVYLSLCQLFKTFRIKSVLKMSIYELGQKVSQLGNLGNVRRLPVLYKILSPPIWIWNKTLDCIFGSPNHSCQNPFH